MVINKALGLNKNERQSRGSEDGMVIVQYFALMHDHITYKQ